MEPLQKLWNYQPDPEQARSLKSRALKGLCLFLAVMVCCTIVSRAADSMTLAVVNTAAPQRQVISHTVKAEGNLEALERIPVVAESGAMVQQVAVREGQQVEEGDLLFVLDVTDLQKQLSQKQLQLQRLNLELAAQQEKDALDAQRKDLTLSRAEEDFTYTKDKAERATAAALDEMNEARKQLDSYDGDKYEDKEAYDAAMRVRRAEYRAKTRSYEQALADEQEILNRAERDIADAALPEINISADLLSVDIQLTGLEISWLYEVVASGGQVYAPASGIVSSLTAEVGKRTGSDASAYIVREGNLLFTAEVTEEQQKYIERGSPVSLTLSGSQRAATGLSVASVSPLAGTRDYRITVELPEGTGQADLHASAEIVQRSVTYETCVPLSCLYTANGQYYVYVLDTTDTPLGLERTVRRVDVTLQESNETMAAVTGALSRDSRVISTTDRALSSGDRVRLQEGA